MNIYDDTNKTKPKRLHDASSKVHASWSEPMPGSDKSASRTSGTCHCSRTGTAIRVAGRGSSDQARFLEHIRGS